MTKDIIAVRYNRKLKHKRAKAKIWQAFTCASEEAQIHVLKAWRKGELALLIPRDKFYELIAEKEKNNGKT